MKFLKLVFLLSIFSLISCATDQDDNLIADPFFQANEAILVDSDLFENLKKIATDDEIPNENITCINFKYPLTLFVFDETNTFVSGHRLFDDPEFSALLEDLDIAYSISVSFPITSTLDTGEEFIINTKEELRESIDNCLGEELVFECNQLLRNCVFKVGYSYDFENPYLGSLFEDSNGLTIFRNADEIVLGSWTVFLIENELHINIGLINDEETSAFFNFDWKVEYLDGNSLLLKNGDRELVLNQRCDDDISECTNFTFEVCENDFESGISDFILDDYKFCIFDTLELDEELAISFYETEDDAENDENAITTDQVYNNTEANQTIFVRIIDEENELDYSIEITLSSISC